MANHKRKKTKRCVRCTLCTPVKWKGNNKGRFKDTDQSHWEAPLSRGVTWVNGVGYDNVTGYSLHNPNLDHW